MDNWKNVLDEDILKPNVNFAAMFVLNYECLKDFVVSQVRDFYSDHIYFDGEKLVCEESKAYKTEVRGLDKNIENASLKWFMADQIPEDYDRDGVVGGQAIILSIINSIMLEDKGKEYKQILETLSKL